MLSAFRLRAAPWRMFPPALRLQPSSTSSTDTPDNPEGSVPFYKRFWSGKKSSPVDTEVEPDEPDDMQRQEMLYEEMVAQEKAEKLLKLRNKSKLRASDRRMLHGAPPLEGIEFQR